MYSPAAGQLKQSVQQDMGPSRKIGPRPSYRLRIQLSPSPLPRYYRRVFSHYHGITVLFVPGTVTTAVKYTVLSPLQRLDYCGITVVPITVQLWRPVDDINQLSLIDDIVD